MIHTYYNTTDSVAPERDLFESQARSQEEVLAVFFNNNPLGQYQPSQIQTTLFPNAPITSVRRALTNLTERGILEKTTIQRQGPYGRPEYLWRMR